MGSGNKALQIGGLAIIGASIIAIAYFANVARTSAINLHQPTRTAGISESTSSNTTIAEAENSKIHAVEIPFGSWNKELRKEFYIPSSLRVHTGDTVVWANNDTVGHTATSIAFNSPLIWPAGSNEGSSKFNYTFDRPGIYNYFCQIHPHMSGTIYVDSEETERRIISVNHYPDRNTIVEIPYDTAYHNKLTQGFIIPSNAVVESNTRVTWVNNDYVAHTATATDNSFDTNVIQPGSSKTLEIRHTQHRVPYYCQIHPWMQGSLTITPPPS